MNPVSWDYFGIDVKDKNGVVKTIEVEFNLDNLTATQTSASPNFIEAEIQPCPDNWYRLIVGFNTGAITDLLLECGYRLKTLSNVLGTPTYNARAWFWGFQLENVNLNHATSVMYNSSTGTLSRSEDAVTSTTLGEFRGYSGGVIGLRYKLFDAHTQAFNRTLGFGHLSTNNFIGVKIQTDNRPFGQIEFNGSVDFFRQPTVAESGNPKQWTNVAIGHQLDRVQMWVNGVRIGSIDTSCPLFNSGDYPQTILLDSGGTATRFFGRLQYFRAWLNSNGSNLLNNKNVDDMCYQISNNPNKINPWTT